MSLGLNSARSTNCAVSDRSEACGCAAGFTRRKWRPSTARVRHRLHAAGDACKPSTSRQRCLLARARRGVKKPFVYDRMRHDRSIPAERGRSQQPGKLPNNTQHVGPQREQITFESTRLHFTAVADIAIAQRESRRWSLLAKRAFDVSASLIGLILVAPLLGALSVLICLESSGPPLFRHQRVGLRGRRFGCLKLRTMRPDAERRLLADSARRVVARRPGMATGISAGWDCRFEG